MNSAEPKAKRLELQGVRKQYPGTLALNLSATSPLDFLAGTIHALVGENGAGKSTMMGIIGGAVVPSAGEMRLDGRLYDPRTVPGARSQGVEMVRQDSGLVPTLSVEENLILGRESIAGGRGIVQPATRTRIAREMLDNLGLDISPKAIVNTLDLERQKFVELARALHFNPKVLIVDEMTASLSESGVRKLFEHLREVASSGALVLYISHHLEEIFEICDRISVLKDGRLVETLATEDVTEDHLSTLMVGRETKTEMFHTSLRPETNESLVFQGEQLTGSDAFQDVDISVHKGEIVGIAGLIGCGSEQLGRTIFGAHPLKEGTMKLDGIVYSPNNQRQAISRGVGYVPSDRDTHGVVLNLPIYANIVLSVIRWLAKFGVRTIRADIETANRLIRSLGIATSSPTAVPASLSGGNRQRVVMAKWMVRPGSLLILHNPTRGVDVGAKAALYKEIRKLTQSGQAILLISDDLPEVLGLSDRILVMRRGLVVGEFSRHERATEHDIVSLML